MVVTVLIAYSFFGTFCCIAWGGKDKDYPGIRPLITDDLPENFIGYGVKILFSVNLFFSYPLQLYPAHIVIENILYVGWPKSKKRQMMKNISRSCLVLFTVLLTVSIGTKLDKFLGIMGALTCTPIAFTFPALFHLKAVAETKCEKIIDIIIVLFSIFVLIFCTTLGFINWSAPEE